MTAQVAVLNTQGVALASDSAVTITGGAVPRTYQSADKIFPIQGEPVAVLHSGTASFWGVPWQVLVETWSQDRDRTPQPIMAAYAREFVDWLATQATVLTPQAKDNYFQWMVRDVLLVLRGVIHRRLGEMGVEPVAGYAQGPVAAVVDEVTEAFIAKLEAAETYEGLETFDGAGLFRRLSDSLFGLFEWVFDDTPRTTTLEGRLEHLGSLLATKVEPFERDAVLAFVGYGAEDFFPSCYRMTVSGAVGDVVRVCDTSTSAVSTTSQVTIVPLGQTAAIDLFLRGVSPQYRAVAHDALDELAGDAVDAGGEKNDIDDAHAALDEEFDTLEWQSFLSPMLDVVETLPVVETLRLADSLVGLASLRGLIHGESSVGGPVDLARISKQRGFEWVRSKNTHAPTLQ